MQTSEENTTQYVCPHCHKHYIRESSYAVHLNKCPTMLKRDEFQSIDGQMAWDYYKTYQRCRGRAVCGMSNFFGSKMYNLFLKFARFVKSVRMPHPNKFIKLMCEHKRHPSIWTHASIYDAYMTQVDQCVSPLEQAVASMCLLDRIAESHEVEIGDVFSFINPAEIIRLVECRKLSAWLLLFSSKYVDWHCTLSEEQQLLIETHIRTDSWNESKLVHREDILKVKELIREFGL